MLEVLRPGKDFLGVTVPFYCNDGKGNFLMHQRSGSARDEYGVWDFGGERLETLDESIESGVLRGVLEEWGVRGEIQEQLPPHLIRRVSSGETTVWLAIPHFIKVDIYAAKIMESAKFSQMGIFRLDSLPRPLHSGAKFTMKRYPEIFRKYG